MTVTEEYDTAGNLKTRITRTAPPAGRRGKRTRGFSNGGTRLTGPRRTELVLPDEQAAKVDPLVGVHDELRLARLARQKQQGKDV